RFLQKLLPERPDLWNGEFTQLRYLPERRFVTQLVVKEKPHAIVKLYDSGGYSAALRNNAFHSRNVLQVARRLGQLESRHAIAQEYLSGVLLSRLMSASNFDSNGLEVAGQAIAEVHRQTPTCLHTLTTEQEAATLFPLAEHIAFLFPYLADRVRKIATRFSHAM